MVFFGGNLEMDCPYFRQPKQALLWLALILRPKTSLGTTWESVTASWRRTAKEKRTNQPRAFLPVERSIQHGICTNSFNVTPKGKGTSVVHNKIPQAPFYIEILRIKQRPTKEQWATLPKLSALRSLRNNEEISAEVLKEIGKIRSLTTLHLGGCPITQKMSLAPLAKLRLTHLVLNSAGISDVHLQQLRPSLEFLDLGGTKVTDTGLRALPCQRLDILVLANCPNIKGPGLVRLTDFPRLRQLYLDGTSITDTAIVFLSKMKQLRILTLHETKISEKGARKLQAALPDCVIFHPALEQTPAKETGTQTK